VNIFQFCVHFQICERFWNMWTFFTFLNSWIFLNPLIVFQSHEQFSNLWIFKIHILKKSQTYFQISEQFSNFQPIFKTSSLLIFTNVFETIRKTRRP
jgi:hypothetical protein